MIKLNSNCNVTFTIIGQLEITRDTQTFEIKCISDRVLISINKCLEKQMSSIWKISSTISLSITLNDKCKCSNFQNDLSSPKPLAVSEFFYTKNEPFEAFSLHISHDNNHKATKDSSHPTISYSFSGIFKSHDPFLCCSIDVWGLITFHFKFLEIAPSHETFISI